MSRLAIFVSGNGTNMENLIKEIQAGKIPGLAAGLVVCDNPEAKAIERARRLGVELVLVERKKFASKEAFENEIILWLERKQIDWIALAGFMRILSPSFVSRYQGRIVNIHPALLPAFPGAHAIRKAFEHPKFLESGSGVTVHFVNEGVDTGPVILQKRVLAEASDTLESFEAKIHQAEYQLYPEALRKVVSGEIKFPLRPRAGGLSSSGQ